MTVGIPGIDHRNIQSETSQPQKRLTSREAGRHRHPGGSKIEALQIAGMLPHPRHPCRSAPAPPTPLSKCSQTPDPLLLSAGDTPHALPKISKPETSGPVFRNSSPQPPAPLHHWQASSALLLLCVTVSSVLLLKPWAQMPYTWPRASPRRDQRYNSSEVAPRDISRPNAATPRAHLRTATSQLKASTRTATSDLASLQQ